MALILASIFLNPIVETANTCEHIWNTLTTPTNHTKTKSKMEIVFFCNIWVLKATNGLTKLATPINVLFQTNGPPESP